MQSVKDENPDDFEEINSILNRYNRLEENRQELSRKNKRQEAVFEELKESITSYQKEGEEHKLDLTNKV